MAGWDTPGGTVLPSEVGLAAVKRVVLLAAVVVGVEVGVIDPGQKKRIGQSPPRPPIRSSGTFLSTHDTNRGFLRGGGT